MCQPTAPPGPGWSQTGRPGPAAPRAPPRAVAPWPQGLTPSSGSARQPAMPLAPAPAPGPARSPGCPGSCRPCPGTVALGLRRGGLAGAVDRGVTNCLAECHKGIPWGTLGLCQGLLGGCRSDLSEAPSSQGLQTREHEQSQFLHQTSLCKKETEEHLDPVSWGGLTTVSSANALTRLITSWPGHNWMSLSCS